MIATVASISEQLKKHNIRPSHQRIKIYDYLVRMKNHPSVDQIFCDLREEIPTLSKTTIYSTLKEFYKNKLVLSLTIDDQVTRYDADTSIHGHFICEKCGSIHDFDVDQKLLGSTLMDIVEVKEHHLYLRGICKEHKNEAVAAPAQHATVTH